MSGRRFPASSRIRVALVVVLVVVLVVSATIAYVTLLGGRDSPLDDVPREADAVAHVDVREMTATDRRRALTRRTFAVQADFAVYRGPRVGPWVSTFDRSRHVELSRARSLTAFVAHGPNATRDETYRAVVVRAPWGEASTVRAVEDDANVTLRRTSVGGRTVYVPPNRSAPTVGILGRTRYVVGTRSAVVDAVAVANGSAEPVAGPLRERFASTSDGFVTLVYPFPQAVVPALPDVVGYGFERTRHVTGVYYANGSSLGARFGLHTTDTDAARNLETTVGLGLQLYAANTQDEVIRRAVHEIHVRRNGRSVYLTYEARPARVETLLERLE